MKNIYKYQLTTHSLQILRIPPGAAFLKVDVQRGVPCLWAIVDTDTDEEEHVRVHTFTTGGVMPKDLEDKVVHIGTYLLEGGNFVGHVFVDIPATAITYINDLQRRVSRLENPDTGTYFDEEP